jgi:hypothetical protein
MKPFWFTGLIAVGFMAMAVNCGPQHKYCPNEPDMECRPYEEGGPPGGGGAGGRDLGPCDGGSFTPLPDGGVMCL